MTLEFEQTSEAINWNLDSGGYLPFGGWSRMVPSVQVEGAVTNVGGAGVWAMPYLTPNYGAASNLVQLTWPEAVKGRVIMTSRMDNPF